MNCTFNVTGFHSGLHSEVLKIPSRMALGCLNHPALESRLGARTDRALHGWSAQRLALCTCSQDKIHAHVQQGVLRILSMRFQSAVWTLSRDSLIVCYRIEGSHCREPGFP